MSLEVVAMRTKNNLLVAALLIAAGATFPVRPWVRAQDVANEKQISLTLAQEVATATIEPCRKDGYRVAVTVVDRAGQAMATLRDDGAGPRSSICCKWSDGFTPACRMT
jgi:hypothetical protein